MIWGHRSQGKMLKDTRISTSTFIDHKKNLVLGDHVYIGHFNFIEASQGIELGEGCQVTNFVNITTHSSHHSLRVYGKQYSNFADHAGYIKGPVKIGAYTFVGPHVVIMPGTTIGKGCIVAAYSYVRGTFPDFSIIKGNPATAAGSTKEMDEKVLNDHPELRTYYQEWQDK